MEGDWGELGEGGVILLLCVLRINLEHINYICIHLKASRGRSEHPKGDGVLKGGISSGVSLQDGAMG